MSDRADSQADCPHGLEGIEILICCASLIFYLFLKCALWLF